MSENAQETKPADNKARDEKRDNLAKSLMKKLKASAAKRAAKAKHAAEYREFEFGLEPGQMWERLSKAVEAGDWDQTTLPLHAVFRQTMIPSLFAEDPRWQAGSQDQNEEARGFSRICQALSKRIAQEYDLRGELVAAFADGLPWGDGYGSTDFDSERKLARIRWNPSARVLVDCETDGNARTHQRRWVAVQKRMPLSEAQAEWPDHEFKPSHERQADDDQPVEMVDIVCVYLQGNNPWTDVANTGADPGEKIEPGDKQDVSTKALQGNKDTPYTGKQAYVVLELRGGLDTGEAKVVDVKDRWPGITDHDAFLIRHLRPVPDDTVDYGTSVYQMSHSSVVMASWAMTWYNTHIHNSASQAILYVGDKFSVTNLSQIFSSRRNLRLAKVDTAEALPSRGGMEIVDLCKPNPEIQKAVMANMANAEKLNNVDQIRMEARSHTSATSDAIRNEYAQLYLGWFKRCVHQFASELMRDAIMTCRYYMSAEEVAAWIGDDLMGWEEKPDPDNPQEKIRVSRFWSDKPEARDIARIRREVDVQIVPNSMSFKAPQVMAQELKSLFEMQMMLVDKLTAQGMIVPPEVYMPAANMLFERTAALTELSNPGDIKFDWTKIQPPPPPPQEPPPPPPEEPQVQLGRSGSRREKVTRGPDGSETREVSEEGPELPVQLLAIRENQKSRFDLDQPGSNGRHN